MQQEAFEFGELIGDPRLTRVPLTNLGVVANAMSSDQNHDLRQIRRRASPACTRVITPPPRSRHTIARRPMAVASASPPLAAPSSVRCWGSPASRRPIVGPLLVL